MAKQYEAPENTKAKEAEKDDRQDDRKATQMVQDEENRQANEAAKRQQAYDDKLKKHLTDIQDAAGAELKRDRQLVNLTVERLRDMANAIEAATKDPKTGQEAA